MPLKVINVLRNHTVIDTYHKKPTHRTSLHNRTPHHKLDPQEYTASPIKWTYVRKRTSPTDSYVTHWARQLIPQNTATECAGLRLHLHRLGSQLSDRRSNLEGWNVRQNRRSWLWRLRYLWKIDLEHFVRQYENHDFLTSIRKLRLTWAEPNSGILIFLGDQKMELKINVQ